MNDWKGNKKSVFVTLGASSHSKGEREKDDYYATEPKAIELLLDEETFSKKVWECACGEGHLSKVLIERGYTVKSTDLKDRGYGTGGINFLAYNGEYNGDIITNPPYKYATEFVEKALSIIPIGNKVAMFLRIQFLEGQERGRLFDTNPPKTIYVARKRLQCGKNGVFEGSSATAYCWFVWEKGFKGNPVVKWINTGEEKSQLRLF